MPAMLEIYTTATPNGARPLILLEELGLPYVRHFVDRDKGQQRAPEFLAVNAQGTLPVLVDGALTLTQSNAIMLYLAEKAGRFLPTDLQRRAEVLECQMLAQTDVHVCCGQLMTANRRMPEGPGRDWQIKYHEGRLHHYLAECERRLRRRGGWLAGEYSIADMVLFPAFHDPLFARFVTDPPEFEAWRDWRARLAARPAVQRGVAGARPD